MTGVEAARRMRSRDVDDLLQRANRDADGSYRVLASRALPGTPLGGFRFYGTRPDDPNDVVPHEHRRELRAYGVFAAWVNHVDSKSINTLDTLVSAGGRSIVRHHLLDFGSALGSSAVYPREHWEGFEYLYEGGGAIARRLAAVGFRPPAWRTEAFFESSAVGRFPRHNADWDPEAWRPRVPNPAFLRARADDKFWAARQLAAMSDEVIGAAVGAGQLGDEPSEAFLVRALRERRDAILRTYLPAINPVVDPSLSAAGRLTFANAAVRAGVAQPARGYRVTWSLFDNATGIARPLGETMGSEAGVPAPAELPSDAGAFVLTEIRADGGPHGSWETPLRAYFRRLDNSAWKWVGLERLPPL